MRVAADLIRGANDSPRVAGPLIRGCGDLIRVAGLLIRGVNDLIRGWSDLIRVAQDWTRESGASRCERGPVNPQCLRGELPAFPKVPPGLFDSFKEARIVLELIVLPVLLRPESDQHSGGATVLGDDDILVLCQPETPRKLISDLLERDLLHRATRRGYEAVPIPVDRLMPEERLPVCAPPSQPKRPRPPARRESPPRPPLRPGSRGPRSRAPGRPRSPARPGG